jgi:hypothetical protein
MGKLHSTPSGWRWGRDTSRPAFVHRDEAIEYGRQLRRKKFKEDNQDLFESIKDLSERIEQLELYIKEKLDPNLNYH